MHHDSPRSVECDEVPRIGSGFLQSRPSTRPTISFGPSGPGGRTGWVSCNDSAQTVAQNDDNR